MSAEKCEAAQPPALPELWKVAKVAEALSLSQPMVYKLMDSGRLPYVKIGRCRRVKRDEVLKLLERSTVARE